MISVETETQVEASPNAVWAVLGRFMHINEFHPRVTRVDALTDAQTGVGASRRCHFKDGTSAVEKVVDWQEGRSYQVQLSEFSLPLKQLFMTLAVEPIDAAHSRLKMTLRYQVKFGPLGWLMGKTMMAMMMRKMMAMVLGGLRDRVTRGASVSAAA